ncbi:hypothetical protein [Sphingobacterium bovistauri]|uniref:Lipoprotein n=1 Tax=Sphingobacterium bovistauri TaxID=2781959 RepID=A0ABS7Z4Z7_9SPHI|nr:hypothetical protein [Sphingobacterium bovistauri]MCA5005212.1 hypothetical protein [Sphingobacterium bovistauri]
MKNISPAILCIILLLCYGACKERKASSAIDITWKDSVAGDFSFTEQWSYPEGVYKNKFGQLSCDGICPPETDLMKDENGKIYEDSLQAFYKVVDTTHIYSTMQSQSTAIEFTDPTQMTAERIDKDTIEAFTRLNSATHSALKIKIIKDHYFIPTVELISIHVGDKIIYPCIEGKLEMDKMYWKKRIIKANFSFLFFDKEQPNKPIEWNGKIFSKIESN